MRIHITQDQPDIDGFLNTRNFDITQLCQKYECDELYCPEVLNYLSFNESQTFFEMMAQWLAPNTKVTIGGVDFYILAKTAMSRMIDLSTLNKIIFDRNSDFLSLHSISQIKELMIELGFKIQDINFDHMTGAFTIEALK